MNEEELDHLVDAVRRQPLPPCPGALEQNVLRRLRVARADEPGLGGWLERWLPQPLFLAASVAVVLAASFATAAILAPSSPPSRSDTARVALGFDAFADPLSLPTDHQP